MAMTARMRRLIHDYQQIEKDFKNHKNIVVSPLGIEPYEKYHVTYYVPGIYLDNNGRINTLNTHEVEITLHAEYPTYKPICRILTPIWHPNFRDGQICIGDIWGAGESLTDIIINIGDMIQYKSWNSSSPLSADAARWALENKNLFPVGNINLNISEYVNGSPDVPSQNNTPSSEPVVQVAPVSNVNTVQMQQNTVNDIEFSASDFIGVSYVPSAQRMQQMSQQMRSGQYANGGGINLEVILKKGILWGIIGGIIGYILSEFLTHGGGSGGNSFAANILGHPFLSKVYSSGYTYEALEAALKYDFFNNQTLMANAMDQVSRVSTGIWSALIASMIGLFLGLGEGIYYGSKDNAVKYATIGFGISIVIGFISGDIAQLIYANAVSNANGIFMHAFIRGIGWSIMGAGIGAAIGLIKFDAKRFLYCIIGGAVGAFLGGFAFDFVIEISRQFIPNDDGIISRLVGIVLTGLLIGAGVGLLEQFAKSAWLKVIRGEFEGKEFLVFNGLTSVGGTGKNSIVLFKDKLVAPHHFDINMQGNKYMLIDCGSPMGTIVNGRRVDRYMLRNGDTISIGNTMLVFNSR